MAWAEEEIEARARELGARLEWPSDDESRPADDAANGSAEEDRADGHDMSPARGYFLGQPPGVETEVPAAGAKRRPPADLERVLRDGAQRFESLIGSCQAELQDTVAAHVSDLEQSLATGTAELNRAADQRIADLEEAVDARLREMREAAVNERLAQIAARVTTVGRLAIVAVVIGILALGAAVASLAVALS